MRISVAKLLSIPALLVLVSCGGDAPDDVAQDVAPKRRTAKSGKKARKRVVKRSNKLVDLAPPDSVMLFHLPDLKKARTAMTRTAIYQIFEERDVQRTLAAPIEAIQEWVKRVRLHEGIDVEKLLKELDGETVVAITRDHMFAAIELGDAYLAAHGMMRKLGHSMFDLEKIDEIDVFTARSMGAAKDAPKLQICFRDGRMIAAVGEGALARVLDGYEALVSDNEHYKASIEHGYGDRAAYRAFVDLEQLVAMLGREGGAKAKTLIDAFDLDALSSIVMAGYMENTDFFDRVALVAKREDHFLAKFLRSGKPTAEALACVPDTCESVSFVRLDLTWLPAFAKRVAADVDEDAAQGVTAALGQAEDALGMPLEDFLTALGDSWFTMSVDGADEEDDDSGQPPSLQEMMTTGGIGSTILAVRTKDAKKVKAALDRLAEQTPGMSPVRFRQGQGYVFDAPELGDGTPSIQPHVALRDDLLIIAATRKAIYRYLERDHQSIMRNPTFEFRWRSMPDTICGLGYTDLRPGMERILNVAGSFAPMLAEIAAQGNSDGFHLPPFPAAGVINRHLTPITTTCEVIDQRIVMESRSPIGSVTMLAPVAAVTAAIAIPKLIEARMRDGMQTRRAPVADTPEPMATPRPTTQRTPRTVKPILARGEPTSSGTVKFGNEHSTLYVLRTMMRAQTMFKQATNVDVDGDGDGEFGTFAELSGSVRLRGSIRNLDPPILTPGFGKLRDGLLKRRGYNLRLFLPGRNGVPRPERTNGGASSSVDPDLAEAHWCVLAWPQSEQSGSRSFYVDQKGIVYESRYPYRGDERPIDIAEILKDGNDLRSGLSIGGPAADGSQWHPVK